MSLVVEFLLDLAAGRWLSRFQGDPWQSTAPRRRRSLARQQLSLRESAQTVEKRCREIVTSLGTERSAEAGVVEVVTRANRRSSGTVIRVQLQQIDGRTSVEVTAWPGAQLFDFGESKRLARSIATQLLGG